MSSLSAQDIVTLARAGYSAQQISLIGREMLSTPSTDESTPSTDESTPSTPPTPSTVSTPSAQPSTVSTPAAPAEVKPAELKPAEAAPAAPAQDPAAAPQDPAPTMQDLMSKLAALENTMRTHAINRDQQPGQEDRLTGEMVLANIIDPRQK